MFNYSIGKIDETASMGNCFRLAASRIRLSEAIYSGVRWAVLFRCGKHSVVRLLFVTANVLLWCVCLVGRRIIDSIVYLVENIQRVNRICYVTEFGVSFDRKVFAHVWITYGRFYMLFLRA